jgi:hypothetical protein
VPVTFQGAVRKFMKNKLESKLVDLSFVAGGKAGDVIGMHMRRSERLVWLTYSIVVQGFAFLPLDAQYGAQVVEYRLRDSEAAVCCVDEWSLACFQVSCFDLFLFRGLFRLIRLWNLFFGSGRLNVLL